MATIDFPTSLPAATTWTGTETAADVDHADDLHNKDRGEIRALGTKLGTGSSTPARGKALVASGSGTSTWDTLGRKNVLINGSFRVWQRGTSPTVTDNNYGPDRWRLLLEAASAAAIAQETSDVPTSGGKTACKLTVGSGEDNKFGIWQVLEGIDVKHLRGQTVSLQAKLKATAAITDVRMAVVEFTGTEDSVSGDPISSWGSAGTNPTLAASYAYLGTPANLSPTTSWATYRVEGLTVGASANNLAVMIWCEDESTTVTTDILRITDVQLEEGAVCTEIERRPYVQELALCQRYYDRLQFSSTTIVAFLAFSGDTAGRGYFTWAIQKRVAPTVTFSTPLSDWGVRTPNYGSDVTPATLASSGSTSVDRTGISTTHGSSFGGYSAGQAGILRAVNATYVEVAAEL